MDLTLGGERRRRWIMAAIMAAMTGLAIVLIHRQSPRTLISAHGLLHTAIAQQFEGSVASVGRPENPFFAGESLPYYWAFHYFAARISQILGIHPLQSIELMILAAVGLLWLTAAALGQRLYGRVFPGVAIGFLSLAGANALGAWYFFTGIMFRGAAVPSDSPNYLWGIVHPIMGQIRFHDPSSLYGPLLNFFLNVTARPVALVLLLLSTFFLLKWLQSGRRDSWWGLVLTTAGAALFSPIIGIPGALALMGGVVLACFSRVPADPEDGGRWLSRVSWAAAAIVAGLLLASPTNYHLFQRTGDSEVAVALRLPIVGTVLVSTLVLLVLAVIGVARATGTRHRFLFAVTAASLALLAGSTVIQLPAGNSTNFFHAGAFLLAIPAAGALAPLPEIRSGRWLLAAAALLFLPTPALVLYAYTNRPPVPMAIEGTMLRRLPSAGPLAQLYAWVERATSRDAIFVVDSRPPLWTALGNVLEFPALTRRMVFTGQATNYMSNVYPDSELRQGLVVRLLEGHLLSEPDRAYLEAFQRPIYLVSRQADDPQIRAALQTRCGKPVFERDEVAVFIYAIPSKTSATGR